MEKRIAVLALTAGVVLSFTFLSRRASSSPTCPDTDLGETSLDCPWAEIARKLIADADDGKPVEKRLRALAPKIAAQLDADRKSNSFKSMWGRSINFDEFAKGIVVHPGILDALTKLGGVSPREERVVHAGIEHTYGYLFSTLKTPFGYKRARWVQDEIEKGFGLRGGSLGPTPETGTLLQNLTYFMGRISLRDSGAALAKLAGEKHRIDSMLVKFPYDVLKIVRLEERVKISETRTVELRTELVEFRNPLPAPSKNTHLLIYSIVDPDANPSQPLLISAFPVARAFVDGVVKPENLGDSKPVVTRYNAFVAGLTGVSPPLLGTREILGR